MNGGLKETKFQVSMIEGIEVTVKCNARPSVRNCSPIFCVKRGKASIELPTFTWDLVSVVHEGIHLAHWIVYEVLGDDDRKPYRGLVPRLDSSWRRGMDAIQEEAVCRLSDKWMKSFIVQAKAAGLEYQLLLPR